MPRDEETEALVRQLAPAAERGDSVRLTPEFVRVALSALQSYVDRARLPEIDKGPKLVQLALLDGEGRTERILATIKDAPIARAALEAAKTQHSEHRLKLQESR